MIDPITLALMIAGKYFMTQQASASNRESCKVCHRTITGEYCSTRCCAVKVCMNCARWIHACPKCQRPVR
jgi:hypothetical protein